jgi:hypothetical protein
MNINNLTLRFQDYDNAGTKYTFDIHYTTTNSPDEYIKAKRLHGADVFSKHIKDLTENYDHVATITVSDYNGTARNAHRINPPVTIRLIEKESDKQTSQAVNNQNRDTGQTVTATAIPNPNFDVLQGLSGLFSGTEFAGFGNLAPVAKYIDDKHTISRLREKHDEQSVRFAEFERKNAELSAKYQSLSKDYEQLQAEADEMDEELEYYRSKEQKQANWMNMVGVAGASIAKSFLRQHPDILSGIIPVEQLSGILSADENSTEPASVSDLSEEEQERLDKATSMFEWFQALKNPLFDEVYSILSVIGQQPAYAQHIIRFLSGKSNKSE